jgi:endonuclease G
VRRLASERGEVFVVTGPVFSGRSVDTIKNRVLVPTQLYKAIYDPRTGEAGAYLAPNEAGGTWKAVSLAALQDIAGIDVFPGLPEVAKTRAMDLPEPREFSRGEARGESFGDFLKQLAHDALKRIWREVMRAIF